MTCEKNWESRASKKVDDQISSDIKYDGQNKIGARKETPV